MKSLPSHVLRKLGFFFVMPSVFAFSVDCLLGYLSMLEINLSFFSFQVCVILEM